MERIQELLLTLQPGAGGAVADIRPDPSLGDVPGTDDVLSLAASANLFSEGVTGEEAFWGGLPLLCSELWAQHRGSPDRRPDNVEVGALIPENRLALAVELMGITFAIWSDGNMSGKAFSMAPDQTRVTEQMNSDWRKVNYSCNKTSLNPIRFQQTPASRISTSIHLAQMKNKWELTKMEL
ncbi:unnamed protein product [Gadus morhua 'NCC']